MCLKLFAVFTVRVRNGANRGEHRGLQHQKHKAIFAPEMIRCKILI